MLGFHLLFFVSLLTLDLNMCSTLNNDVPSIRSQSSDMVFIMKYVNGDSIIAPKTRQPNWLNQIDRLGLVWFVYYLTLVRNLIEQVGIIHNFTIFKPSVCLIWTESNKMMNISKSCWRKKLNPRSPLSIPAEIFHLPFFVSLLTSDLDMCSTSNNNVSNVPSHSLALILIVLNFVT